MREADLLLLGADPLQRIENTRDVRGVMQNGRWCDETALATLRGEVEAALSVTVETGDS